MINFKENIWAVLTTRTQTDLISLIGLVFFPNETPSKVLNNNQSLEDTNNQFIKTLSLVTCET